MRKKIAYEKFEKITVKKAKELIKDDYGIIDDKLTKDFHNNVYKLRDGRGLVVYETHAFLHPSMENIAKFHEFCMQSANKPTHILQDKFNYQEDFLLKSDSLKNDFLKNVLQYKSNAVNINDMKTVDSSMIKLLNQNYAPEKYFAGLVAVVGECLISQIDGGHWVMIKKDILNLKVWEPYVVDKNGIHYNPFIIVYKELYESYPESKKINFYELTKIELEMPSNPNPK